MRQSRLFGRSSKDSPKDEVSINADLLYRAGFVEKFMAGVYSYLPLGLRVLDKIKNIVREEMNAIGGQEMLMSSLQPKELWDRTGRWEKLSDVMFQFKGRGDSDIGLASTHEEVLTDILSRRIKSYKDLPVHLYQIQDKFRNEPRAKSGILRGREFSMKDLYSFHANEADFEEFYEQAKVAYLKFYKRCGLDALVTEAPGGDFTTRLTHEFQVLADSGEDTISYCEKCSFSQNKELAKLNAGDKCTSCSATMSEGSAIEVGNIFPLETTYSEPLGLKFTDDAGKQQTVIMGSYGIGLSRVMGTIVEVSNDENGIIWPKEVAPYHVHLVTLGDSDEVVNASERIYDTLNQEHEVLWDDRDASAGQKFADSDLIGIPFRVIVSKKTLAENSVELKSRAADDSEMVGLDQLSEVLNKKLS